MPSPPLLLPLAGMPMLTLRDLAEMRVQAISFFLVVLLVAAWGIKLLWNGLRRDFPRLPRLSYSRALSLVVLWGFLFVLVLTMISGARELMTPGAWEKKGLTYELVDDPRREEFDSARWAGMAELKVELWRYAAQNGGVLPDNGDATPIDWQSPDVTGTPYRYVGGRRAGEGREVVAYEPPLFPSPRLALFSDGTIRAVPEETLRGLTSAPAAEGGGR